MWIEKVANSCSSGFVWTSRLWSNSREEVLLYRNCVYIYDWQVRVPVRQSAWICRRGCTLVAWTGPEYECRHLLESVSASSDVLLRSIIFTLHGKLSSLSHSQHLWLYILPCMWPLCCHFQPSVSFSHDLFWLKIKKCGLNFYSSSDDFRINSEKWSNLPRS